MKVEIDRSAGFCSGVIRAIDIVEEELKKSQQLYCLGNIVHNQNEVDRLASMGLSIIDFDTFKQLKNERVLIRAHGEPPETYRIAKKNNIEIIDASCKVVLALHKQIQKAYDDMKEKGGQIVIFGKAKHPEVIGLNGQCDNGAIIIESIENLGKLDFNKPIRLFAQTTMNIHHYQKLIDNIEERLSSLSVDWDSHFKYVKSICYQVSKRESVLRSFAQENDVVIFVGGKQSSNARFLFDICKKSNDKSYFISHTNELNKEWLENAEKVGVSGATSTPKWLMEEVINKIQQI